MTSGSAADFLAGGGDMGRRVRAFDWASHPIGAPESWPQSLRAMVRLMLNTGHATLIFWGPEFYCLYNDAFAQSLGPEKHPSMLGAVGRPMWEEVWPIVGAQLEAVMAGQGSSYHENQLVPIQRYGKLDQVYWTYSYSPIDVDGAVGGVLVLCTETTRGVIEHRHAALAELADRFRDVEDPDELAFVAAEMLAQRLGVSRAGYGTIDTEEETIRIERDWNAPGVQSIAGTLHFRDYGSYIDDLKAGRTVVVEDADLDPRTAATAASLKAISAQSFVNMPVTEQGGFVALLFLNHETVRPWTEDELDLIRDVAERTRNAVARREAEQALRRNEARLRFLDDLATATATATDADAVMGITTRMLGEHLGGSGCAYADVEADGDALNIRGEWHAIEAPSIVGRYSLSSFGAVTADTLRAGKPLVIRDNLRELGEDGADAYASIGLRSTLCMPFVKDGRLTAMMSIHGPQPHDWTEEEMGLLREVAERSWAHIERVRAEAALRDSESRLRLAVEGARIGTWDWDLKSFLGGWSPRTCEIMGVENGEAITLDQRYASIHPDDRTEIQRAILRSIEQGQEFATEYRIVRPDGEIRWVSSHGTVQRDEAGKPLRTLGTVRDVTERRQAQEALTALNETLEQQVAERTAERDGMWRLSEDLFLVVGPRWDIRAVNPAVGPLLGYSPEELIGERFARYVHPDEFRTVARAIRAAATGPLRDFIAQLRAKDGTWRRFAWSSAPGEGEAFVIGRDVTDEIARRDELERAQDALRQSQKMESLGQLTGGVAHDFNNLLTPIIGSLDLLRRSQTGEREQRLLGAALESAERARTLVQRLLAFARRQPLQPGAVDLGVLIGGMADLIASTSGPQIKVQVDVPAGLPPALADPNQLELAILNLSVNSRDAMPDGGQLTLAASAVEIAAGHRSELAPGAYIRLAVSDSGTGMDEATMARAIEPFFSTKGIGKGTGLGLSMVHGLASQLGGAMLLSSRPGLGTTVELLLPVAGGPALPEAAHAIPCLDGGAGMVLLVDDEAPVRAATCELLRDLGYQVTEVQSGREALDYLAHNPVDFLVTDHLMPGMTGTDLVRTVHQRHPQVKALIVSGYAELEGISPDLPRLAKPFRQDELAASLSRLG